MSYPVVRRFVDRVRQQARAQSRTLNMPMEEAHDLAHELSLLLIRENELLREISDLKSANQITEIQIGGGGFK